MQECKNAAVRAEERSRGNRERGNPEKEWAPTKEAG